MELKKAFWNKRFLFSLSVCSFLSLLSGFLQIRGYIIRTRFLNTHAYQNVADWGKDYHLSAETMADFWIGMDFSTWCATAFFFLLPLLAVLPYGSSLHREYKSGYLNLITPQISQKRYFAAKFLASFLSGGAVIVLPMIVNVIFVACTVPMRLPSVLEVIYNGVYGFGLWAEVFYTHPVLTFCSISCWIFFFPRDCHNSHGTLQTEKQRTGLNSSVSHANGFSHFPFPALSVHSFLPVASRFPSRGKWFLRMAQICGL